MCYNSKGDSGIKTARKDIPVLKCCFIGRVLPSKKNPLRLSGFYQTAYSYNTTGTIVNEEVSLKEDRSAPSLIADRIQQGFYFTFHLRDIYDTHYDAIAWCLFYIPKGSRYRKNKKNKEYISDSYKFGEILGVSSGAKDALQLKGDVVHIKREPFDFSYDYSLALKKAITDYLDSKGIVLK